MSNSLNYCFSGYTSLSYSLLYVVYLVMQCQSIMQGGVIFKHFHAQISRNYKVDNTTGKSTGHIDYQIQGVAIIVHLSV